MRPELHQPKRPYEIFDITEDEVSRWRVSEEKLKEILANPDTSVHGIEISSNTYGEFLFITTSRTNTPQRTCMTFYGLGYHEYRERWITEEWFWQQTPMEHVETHKRLSPEEIEAQLAQRMENITDQLHANTQTKAGHMFETLADITDDDAALAEMQDLGLI